MRVLSGATPRNRWWIVSLLFLAARINYVDRGNLSIAAVAIMTQFNRSPSAMGVLLSAFYWSYAVLQIPAGYLVDRVGLKWTYGVAFLIWSVASAGVGFASSFAGVVILRVILGAGEAAVAPASLACVRRQFSPPEQGLPTGILTSGMIAGPAVGALSGSLLIGRFGWRALFILTGLGSCLWLVPWFRSAPNEKGGSVSNLAVPRGITSTAHLFLLRPVWAITIGAFFYSYYWYFCLTWLPSYLIMSRHFSYLKMGTFTSLPFGVLSVVSPLAGWFADTIIKRGRSALTVRRVFVCSDFLLGSFICLVPAAKSPAVVLLMLVCSLGGIGLASANYWALTEALAPPAVIGRVIGYQNTIANLAGIVAPILTGWLVGKTRGFALAILVSAGALWIAAAAYAILLRENDLDHVTARFSN